MKSVLIIEDDAIFAPLLIKLIEQRLNCTSIWIDRINDYNWIKEFDFSNISVILLDLNLGEKSNVHGEGLLQKIKEDNVLIDCPIIVMTAHDDRTLELLGHDIYTVLRKPIDNFLLLHHIKIAIKLNKYEKELSVLKEIEVKKKHQIDYAIVTALYEDEFEAVKEVFNLKIDKSLKLSDKNIFVGNLDSNSEKKIIATYQSDVGRIEASSLASEIIKEYNPKYLFMTGVCGGSDKTNFGDIIVAKFIFTFDKGKITDEGFFRELEFVKINERLLRAVRENNNQILLEVKKQLIQDYNNIFNSFNFQKLKSVIDPMACSPSVIDKNNYFNDVIKSIDRKATAVEMESYGLARATESTNSGNTKCLIIKSVMDNTTSKDDTAKKYASFTSALYLKKMFEMDIF